MVEASTAESRNSSSMKQNTSTPSFLSLRDTVGQCFGPVEWLPHCNFKQSQNFYSKVDTSRPVSISNDTRRVSSSSSGNNASCNSLNFISSSESLSSSSSTGTRTSDESIESGSITDEDDPIISLQALSLDTQNTGKWKYSGKSLFTPNGMDTQKDKDEDLSSSSFQYKDTFSKSRLKRSKSHLCHFKTSEFDVRREKHANAVHGDSSNEMGMQQRRPNSKKYTIRKATKNTANTSLSETVSPKVSRTKRERGGSDFTMASASEIGNRTPSSSSPRKRRRVNRNQAMGAQDFDSILAQINTTGTL